MVPDLPAVSDSLAPAALSYSIFSFLLQEGRTPSLLLISGRLQAMVPFILSLQFHRNETCGCLCMHLHQNPGSVASASLTTFYVFIVMYILKMCVCVCVRAHSLFGRVCIYLFGREGFSMCII